MADSLDDDLWSRIWVGPICEVPGERVENPKQWHKRTEKAKGQRHDHPAPDPSDPRVRIFVSTSGGKDSNALASYVVRNYGLVGNLTSEGKPRIEMVHADTGLDWPDAEAVAREAADYLSAGWPQLAGPDGFPFHVVEKFDLDENLLSWLDFVPEKGLFPSRVLRWCTSDFKRDPIDKWLRNHLPKPKGWRKGDAPDLYLVALGIRALEGKARNRKRWGSSMKRGDTGWSDPEQYMDYRTDASAQFRLGWTWFPIYKWSGNERGDRPKLADGAPGPATVPAIGRFWDGEDYEELAIPAEHDVWTEIREWGLPIGEAYKKGLSRMSCQFCIMGGRDDLLRAIKRFPQLALRIARLERDMERHYLSEAARDPEARPRWGKKYTYSERILEEGAPLGATMREGKFLDEVWRERPDLAPQGVPLEEPAAPQPFGPGIRSDPRTFLGPQAWYGGVSGPVAGLHVGSPPTPQPLLPADPSGQLRLFNPKTVGRKFARLGFQEMSSGPGYRVWETGKRDARISAVKGREGSWAVLLEARGESGDYEEEDGWDDVETWGEAHALALDYARDVTELRAGRRQETGGQRRMFNPTPGRDVGDYHSHSILWDDDGQRWYADVGDERPEPLRSEWRRYRDRTQATADDRNAVLRAYQGGVREFMDARGESVAVIVPDAGQAGFWRYSAANADGFFTHRTTPDELTAVAAAADDGYVTPAAGTLDAWASTERWADGTRRTAVVQVGNALRSQGMYEAAWAAENRFTEGGSTAQAHAEVLAAVTELRAGRRPEGWEWPKRSNPGRGSPLPPVLPRVRPVESGMGTRSSVVQSDIDFGWVALDAAIPDEATARRVVEAAADHVFDSYDGKYPRADIIEDWRRAEPSVKPRGVARYIPVVGAALGEVESVNTDHRGSSGVTDARPGAIAAEQLLARALDYARDVTESNPGGPAW